jgi:hypothetical protein
MAEVWLNTNRRALLLGMVLPLVLLSLAGAVFLWSAISGQHWAVQLVLLVLTAIPLWMLGELLYAVTRPRVAYEPGSLLVYLEPSRPTRVPIEIVEVMFLGQGPSELPRLKGREPETQNVIIRLADAATEWKHRDVRPAFGHWCEGYITIRGAWCQPITPDLLRKLNHRLVEVKREAEAESEKRRGREGEM